MDTLMRDSRSWRAYIAGVSLLVVTATLIVVGLALALGHARHSSGMITFVAPILSSTSTALYALDMDSGLGKALVPGAAIGDCAEWSPDGKGVALVWPGLARAQPPFDSAGGLHFYQVPTSVIAWSADSDQLLLEMDLGPQVDIFLMDVASGDLRNLTADHEAYAFQPIWSRDGNEVIFLSPSNVGLDVYMTSVDSTGLRRVASMDTTSIELMGWRAESRELVLLSRHDNPPRFYSLDVDSSTLTLIAEPMAVHVARLAPDSRRLAFSSESYSEIYLLELNGEPLRHIYTTSIPRGIGDMQWSPDGTRLAFAEGEWSSPTHEHEALYLFDISAGGPQLLTNAIDAFSPLVWSPDGRYIAFRSDSATDSEGELPGLALNELYTVDVASGNLRRLTYGLGEATCFAWVP